MKFAGWPFTRRLPLPASGFAATGVGLLIVARRSLIAMIFAIPWLAVARGQLDLELVQLVPLGFGALIVRNSQEFLQ
ncbi:MAG: hypothetical protein ABI854_03125, partial [Betaproteobacteria bacterium]